MSKEKVKEKKMCPFLSKRYLDPNDPDDERWGWVDCQDFDCGVWDKSRDCCSFNTKPRVETTHTIHSEHLEGDTLPIPQIKTKISLILREKTGWGRNEIKQRLFELLDSLPHISTLDKHDDDIPF